MGQGEEFILCGPWKSSWAISATFDSPAFLIQSHAQGEKFPWGLWWEKQWTEFGGKNGKGLGRWDIVLSWFLLPQTGYASEWCLAGFQINKAVFLISSSLPSKSLFKNKVIKKTKITSSKQNVRRMIEQHVTPLPLSRWQGYVQHVDVQLMVGRSQQHVKLGTSILVTLCGGGWKYKMLISCSFFPTMCRQNRGWRMFWSCPFLLSSCSIQSGGEALSSSLPLLPRPPQRLELPLWRGGFCWEMLHTFNQ